MELNKRYLQSEYPIENLIAGTIIETFYTEEYNDEDGTLVLITERGGEWEGSFIVAISVKDGEYYIFQKHSIIEYEIKRL